MSGGQEAISSPRTNRSANSQVEFSSNRYAELFIGQLHESDIEGKFLREQLKGSIDNYKDNVQYTNNHFSTDQDIKHILFREKKSFFNHKFNTQEILRSQHLYKLTHELKYTPDRNVTPYPDFLEDGYHKILKVNDRDCDVRDCLLKWYQDRSEMIEFTKKELQRQYSDCSELDDFSETANNITFKIRKCEEALFEVKYIIRNLNSDKHYKNQKQYDTKQPTHESDGNYILESTFSKTIKNFPFINYTQIRRYFNDKSNLHFCTKKIQKVRLLNEYLPYKIQLLYTLKSAKSQIQNFKGSFNFEADEIQRELFRLYSVKRSYLLAQDKPQIERYLTDYAKLIGIKEDAKTDFGSLLLFGIDKKFDSAIKNQINSLLSFQPSSLKSPFITLRNILNFIFSIDLTFIDLANGKNYTEKTQEIIKKIEIEKAKSEGIKIITCNTWIDKLKIIQDANSEEKEQDIILEQYDDALITGWIQFLLNTNQDLIGQKLQNDINVLKEKVFGLNKKQYEEVYNQFYERYLKLLFMKSRDSLIKILSYLNYFQYLQKSINITYVQLMIGHQEKEESQQHQSQLNQSQTLIHFESMDPNLLSHKNADKLPSKIHDEKIFLTNPSITQFNNISEFNKQGNKIANSNEDYLKLNGQALISPNKDKVDTHSKTSVMSDNASKKSNFGNEEEIQLEEEQVLIRDGDNMKILHDQAVHDFHSALEKIAQICSFYFHFKIKHDMSQKEKDKVLFKDNYDREALIEAVLSLEQQFYYNKVKLLRILNEILKNTYSHDLRKQLVIIMTQIIKRRPRMSLFENNVFQCYHYEIQVLSNFNEILERLSSDLSVQEDNLAALLKKSQPQYRGDKLLDFYLTAKQSKLGLFMPEIAKLVINIEMSRTNFFNLIPSSLSDPAANISEVLKCQFEFFKSLLEQTKKIALENEGSDLLPELAEFQFLEKDQTLDKAENFEIVENCVKAFISEKLSKQEREKINFDAFSMVEFIKIRRKINNFLFGLTTLLDIYRLQVNKVGEDFQKKFESSINVTAIVSEKQKTNYLKLLLDLDAIKIAKEIMSLENWMNLIIRHQSLSLLTQQLQSLILCTQLTLNCVMMNNIYLQTILNDMTRDFFVKLRQAAPSLFCDIFTKKKLLSSDTLSYIRTQELNKEKKNQNKKEVDEGGKNHTLTIFCKRLKREVQFDSMKVQTLLQRNLIEKFQRKLPFEENLFYFAPLSPVKEVLEKNNSFKNESHEDDEEEEEIDLSEDVFFDHAGTATNIFRIPSSESIIQMGHEDFELIMERNKINKFQEEDVDGDENNQDDYEKRGEKSYFSGGKDWLKAQEQKIEKDISLISPNKNLQAKGSSTLQGFRKRDFLEHSQLLYLKKTQLFTLWKVLGNLINIQSLIMFECSFQADVMDILFFSHGQLGYEKCKIDSVVSEDLQNQLNPATAATTTTQQQKTDNEIIKTVQKGKSLKELTSANKRVIPIYKRNELRLKKDIQSFITMLSDIEGSIQIIKKNPKIVEVNEAIIGYLEKFQNRHFLQVLLLLIKQLNISRDKKDYEFMASIRTLIIELNFPQISQLAKFEDGKILLAKNIKFHDDSGDFTQSPDLKVYHSSSPFMNLIRIIFWDTRPKIEQQLYSIISTLNPSQYLFSQFMKYSSLLDKGLRGISQENVNEMNKNKSALDLQANSFLKVNYISDAEDPYKYERMFTKIIKLQVRNFILREIYLIRKLNILPFEAFPNCKDPLQEPIRLAKQKIMAKSAQKLNLFHLQQQPHHQRQHSHQSKDQDLDQPPIEEEIFLNLTISSFQVQTLLYQEAIDFYYEENLLMSKWISISRKKEQLNSGNISDISEGFYNNGVVYDPAGLSKSFATGNPQVQDTLSVLSCFTTKVLFDSSEIKSLNRNVALVIAKEDLIKHLHNINLDLINLIEKKYSQTLGNIHKKNDILHSDVLFQKQWNRLLNKKIEFLEKNSQSLVESEIASRSNELVQEIQFLQKKASYTKEMMKIDKQKIQIDINKKFSERLRENTQVNHNTLSRFYDFRKGEKLEVYNMVQGIKEHNFQLLKEQITKALEEHGGSDQVLQVMDKIWKQEEEKIEEEEEQQKKQQQQQSQQSQQQSQQVTSGSQMNQNEDQALPILNSKDDYTDLLPTDVYERIEVQNKEVYKLLETFRLVRAFNNMKTACLAESYQKEIQKINENNSSNDQLYKDKNEMEQQTEFMKQKVLLLKKTMSIMEYQNEILRRDVQRQKLEKIKGIKLTQNKDDRIKELEEKVEASLKEKINTINNFSQQSFKRKSLKITTTQIQDETSFINSLPHKTTDKLQTTNQLKIIPSSRPITVNSTQSDFINRYPVTSSAALGSKSIQNFQISQQNVQIIEQSPEQLIKSNKKQQQQEASQKSIQVGNSNSKQNKLQLSTLIQKPTSRSLTSKSSSNPKSLSMTYKIKSVIVPQGKSEASLKQD